MPSNPKDDPTPDPWTRFRQSMALDMEKWRDGIGYDMDALREADLSIRQSIASLLIPRAREDWRAIEPLAELDTDACRAALRDALANGTAEVQQAVFRHAPGLVSRDSREKALIQQIESAGLMGGLTGLLLELETFDTPRIRRALLDATLSRPGDVAMHFAAMLMFMYGQTDEPFDWEQRPFFLTFVTEDAAARARAHRELCEILGVKTA